MSVPIDTLNLNLLHRQVVSSSGLIGGEDEVAQGRPLNAARRIEPVEASEKGRATEDNRLREDRRQQEKAESSTREESEQSGYDRKLSYEAEVNRVYLDIVDTEGDILMRIPSESAAKYLEQVTARSAEEDKGRTAPRIRQSV